jgi:hypothetical protein
MNSAMEKSPKLLNVSKNGIPNMWQLYTKDSEEPTAMTRFVGEFKTKKAAKAEIQKLWEAQPEPRKDILYMLDKE